MIAIGASRVESPPRSAQRVSVLDCVLKGAGGDGVAIVPAPSTDPRNQVSDITISGCHFLGNRRSGVSNQRLAKRVSILHNRFEGTSDQDIDFEPTGDLRDSGPSGYLILGNTMVRSGAGVSVTLSGTSLEAASRVNTFAFNQLRGGSLGVHHAQDLAIVGNSVEVGPRVEETVVLLSGAIERVLFADNTVVRGRTAPDGTLMNVTAQAIELAFRTADPAVDVATNTFTRKGHQLQTQSGPLRASVLTGGTLPGGLSATQDYWAIRIDKDQFRLALTRQAAADGQAVDVSSKGAKWRLMRHAFPRAVTISRNRFSTYRAPKRAGPLIIVTNASTVSFRDNDIASYAGVQIFIALKLESKASTHKRPLSGWEVVGNHFRGNGKQPPEYDLPATGVFGTGVSMSVGSDTVREVRVAGNTFAGCNQQVELHANKGQFFPVPYVAGNIGDGIALVLSGIDAVLVGGNLSSTSGTGAGAAPAGARYAGRGEPTFVAPVGSLYSHIGPESLPRLYINTDGATQWHAIALA